MAPQQASAIALLPIRPEYAAAIMSGDKRVEFRRRKFARIVDYVVVYASSPVQRILGFFRVSRITEGRPQELWDRYSQVGAIDRQAFNEYYSDAKQAFAIEIERVCVLQRPVPLSALGEAWRAPQSYQYIDHSDLDRITEISHALVSDDKAEEARFFASRS